MRPVLGIALLTAAVCPASAQTLTIGSPAPRLDVAAYVKGEPVKEMAKGTVYVIEFSGTYCVPCAKVIPQLTALQKQYPGVVFVSVYSEPEADVRAYLAKNGDRMGFRVAADPAEKMLAAWAEPAGRQGIPDAFVVDKTGAVAWIGRPWDLAGPLGQIVAGTFDPRLDRVRLRFEAAAAGRTRRHNEQAQRLSEAAVTVTRLTQEGKHTEAVKAADGALREVPRQAAIGWSVVWARLRALAADPAAADRAVAYGIEVAADLQFERTGKDWTGYFVGLAGALVWLPGDRKPDVRLADLAAVLAEKAVAEMGREPTGDSGQRSRDEFDAAVVLADAHRYRGDPVKALAAVDRALGLIPKLKTPDGHPDPDRWRKGTSQQKAELEALRVDLRKAAGAK